MLSPGGSRDGRSASQKFAAPGERVGAVLKPLSCAVKLGVSVGFRPTQTLARVLSVLKDAGPSCEGAVDETDRAVIRFLSRWIPAAAGGRRFRRASDLLDEVEEY